MGDLELVNVASLASASASALLVARGAVHLREGRRAAAYVSFERALLVAIFVTQVFAFFESQFGAVFGLGVDLLLLAALRSLRAGDEHHDAHPGVVDPTAHRVAAVAAG